MDGYKLTVERVRGAIGTSAWKASVVIEDQGAAVSICASAETADTARAALASRLSAVSNLVLILIEDLRN